MKLRTGIFIGVGIYTAWKLAAIYDRLQALDFGVSGVSKPAFNWDELSVSITPNFYLYNPLDFSVSVKVEDVKIHNETGELLATGTSSAIGEMGITPGPNQLDSLSFDVDMGEVLTKFIGKQSIIKATITLSKWGIKVRHTIPINVEQILKNQLNL